MNILKRIAETKTLRKSYHPGYGNFCGHYRFYLDCGLILKNLCNGAGFCWVIYNGQEISVPYGMEKQIETAVTEKQREIENQINSELFTRKENFK